MKRVCVALLLFGVTGVHAQQYPARPIRLVASNPPGSGSDVVARVIAPR